MSAIAEMGRYIAGSITLARGKRLFAELLGWEACGDIHAEIVAGVRQVRDEAHRAETYDREALRAMDEAAAPQSEGGLLITPAEAQRIRALVARSAEHDHNASELASV